MYRALRPFALTFLVIWVSTKLVFGQAPTFQETVTLKKVSVNDGLVLGNGVSLDKIAPAYSSPFERISITRIRNPNSTAKLRIYVATSARALDEATGVDVKVKARFLFASAEANTEVSRNASISENSFRLVVVGEMDYGHDELGDTPLKPEAKQLIDNGKMDQFSKLYGTHYVIREHRVARLAIVFSVSQWSEETVQALKANVSGGVAVPLAGGDLQVKIQRDLKAAANRGEMTMEISTMGGTGLEGFGALAKATIALDSNPLNNLGDSIEKVLQTFKPENSGISAVTVASYRNRGWDPQGQNLWNDLFENKLNECANKYYAGRKVLDTRAIAR